MLLLLCVVLFIQPTWTHDVNGFMEDVVKTAPLSPPPSGRR